MSTLLVCVLSFAFSPLQEADSSKLDGFTRPKAQRARYYEEEPDDLPAAQAARDDLSARSVPLAPNFAGFTSVQVNVDGNGLNIVGDAANEPSLAIDPTNPLRMAIGWRQFDSITSNFREAGWAWSIDGGATWNADEIDSGNFRSDPVLVADSNGSFFYSSLKSSFLADVFRSDNGAQSWGPAVPSFGGDKQWLAVDVSTGPGAGFLYQIWQAGFGCCFPDTLTRSTDGGASFQSPVEVGGDGPTFGTIDVGPGGDVWAAGISGITFDFSTFFVAHSEDADLDGPLTPTFQSQPVDLGGAMGFSTGPNPGGLVGQAWIAADDIGVFVLASVDPPGPDPLDVHIVRSMDGVNWSAPVRVNDDAMGEDNWQWFGTIDVAPDGRIDVVWNSTTTAVNLSELRYSFSYDAGATWAPSVAVTPVWDSFIGWPEQNKIGDYYELISDAGGASLAYSATFNGEQDVYFVRLTPKCETTVYCTPKINSLGCVPSIATSGSPSIAAGSLVISADQELNNRNGLFFYSTQGVADLPFLGGTLCALPPLRRTAPQNSFGNLPPDDCSGTYSFDFGALAQSGLDPLLIPGAEVAGQFWGRDPGQGDGTGASLTDAVRFVLCP